VRSLQGAERMQLQPILDPWLTSRFRAYAPLALILLAPVASLSWTNFSQSWFSDCIARQQKQFVSQEGVARQKSSNSSSSFADASKYPELAQSENAKLGCLLLESELATGVAIGTFGLVMILWWLASELQGLRQICESRWSGLDDCDVDNIGALKSVAHAAVFIAVALASIGILFLSVAGARDPATIPMTMKSKEERVSVGDRVISNSNPDASGASDRTLVDAIEAQTRIQQKTIEEGSRTIAELLDKTTNTLASEFNKIQTQLDADTKHLDALDLIHQSVDRTEQQLHNANSVLDDLAKAAIRLDQTSNAVATSLQRVDEHLVDHHSSTKDALGMLAKTLDLASAVEIRSEFVQDRG
jgi:hypothetical protein